MSKDNVVLVSQRPCTLSDVAKNAGVSVSAVSHVLNQRNNTWISRETADLVRQTASKMGYRPNASARRLVKGRTFSVGLVMWSPERIEHPWFSRMLGGIERTVSKAGYSLELSINHLQTGTEESGQKLTNTRLLEHSADGYMLLWLDEIDTESVNRILGLGVPVVWLVRYPLNEPIRRIRIDTELGYYLATRHLIEQGCQRVAFIAGLLQYKADQEALAGYRRGLKEAGRAYRADYLVEGAYRREPSIRAMNQLLSLNEIPDGIVACDDVSALQAVNVCRERGLRVPEDIKVIGANDSPLAQLVSPQLSSLQIPAEAIGVRMTEMLIDMIQKKTLDMVEEIIQPELVVRESSLK